jgi:hypothetical protein
MTSLVGCSPDSNGVTPEAGESPLLICVTGKRLVNVLQRNNSCYRARLRKERRVVCSVKISNIVIITSSSEWCVQMVNK